MRGRGIRETAVLAREGRADQQSRAIAPSSRKRREHRALGPAQPRDDPARREVAEHAERPKHAAERDRVRRRHGVAQAVEEHGAVVVVVY